MKHATSHAAGVVMAVIGVSGSYGGLKVGDEVIPARTHEAHSSCRVMPIALATGHAAARLEHQTP
jgi:hypothetical protein